MIGVWRCPVCEGVNQGGRACVACGAVVPAGERVRAAVRARMPAAEAPGPPPVPPTPRRRDLRALPTPEEMYLSEGADPFAEPYGWDVRPLPGGCLVSHGPRRRRRRWW